MFMKNIIALSLSFGTFVALPVAADQVALEQCVLSKVEKFGISPDLAYKTCQRASIVGCIKNLRGKSSVLQATKKVSNGYLIDLGNDKKLWQEGQFWSSRRCKVVKNGPRITKNAPDKNGLLQRYRWFRQGVCPTDTIKGVEYTDQLAFQQCDPGGYLIDSGRNETDKTNIDNLLRGE